MLKAYIDFQNVTQVLALKTGFDLLDLNIHDLIDELADQAGETCVPIHRAYSGVPSKRFDEIARKRQIGIFTALRYKQGIDVFSRDLVYRKDKDGRTVAKEKGIDVRLSCELVADVAAGQITSALIFSWDQDISEAVNVARMVAESQGREFRIYSVQLEGEDMNRVPERPIYPVAHTIPLKLTKTILYRHLRFHDEDEGTADEIAPLDLVVAASKTTHAGVSA